MKKIQNVFEDESNLTLTGLPNKNPEEMEPEDRSEYYRKKKQKIMGSKYHQLFYPTDLKICSLRE